MDVAFIASPLHDAAADLFAVGASEAFAEELAGLDAKLGGALIAHLKQRAFTGKGAGAVLVPTLGRLAAKDLLVVAVGDRSADNLARAAGKAGRQARDLGAKSVALSLGGSASAEALFEAFSVGNYVYDRFKPEADRTAAVETLTLGENTDKGDLKLAGIRAKWQSFTRDLVNAPAANIYPATLADEAVESLKGIPGVTVEVWDEKRLEAEKCVGILGVGQGSTNPPRLIHISYRPTNAKAHVALVGKGVTFDSGGHSLKPSGSMQTMRCDMGGAATVIGATGIAAELGLPIAIDTYIAAVENMISGSAYKLGDIFTYRNGVTCEIHNTDAEGRLVLADCLIEACKQPDVTDVVDLATLTGAIVVALGPDFTGMFTPDDGLAAELSAASQENGELIWRMPLHQAYKPWLKGDWGQIKNISGKPDGGSITAALFLQYFVEGKRWAHLDIAGSAFFDKPSGVYAAGGTGQIVRSLVTWMQNKIGG